VRILEIGNSSYLRDIRPDEVDFFYVGKKPDGTKEVLTFRAFRDLRAKLKGGQYDLVSVSVFGLIGPVWRRERGVVSNLRRIAKALNGRFYTLGAELALGLVRGTAVPLIVVDRKDDPDKIPPHFFGLLRRCRRYFWREMPVKLENGFTFTTSYLEDTSAIRKAPVFAEHGRKIVPLSVGLAPLDGYPAEVAAVPKDIDIFFAGSVKGSQVRQEGLRLLEELKAEGLRVELAGTSVFSHADFLLRCRRSWLVWSPEGHGWDCYRHYEAGLMGSVAVINYPRIRRHRPLVDDVHVFYYGPDEDDLKRVVRSALEDKAKLARMAAAARDHVLAYHTPEKLFEYIVSTGAGA
jgi:hypothetical protein